MRILPGSLMVVGALCCFPARAAAQQGWTLGLDVSQSRIRGGSRDTGGGTDASGHPGSAALLGLRLERTVAGTTRLGLALRYAEPGLVVRGEQLVVEAPSAFTLLELVPTLSVRVAGFPAGPSLRVLGGVALSLWAPTDGESRLIPGGLAGAALEVPLSPGVTVDLRAEALVSGSVFQEADLPDGFERRSTFRTQVGVGVRIGL